MQEALSQLLSPRHVTLILEALYGHRDRFRKGKYEPSQLENKLVAVHVAGDQVRIYSVAVHQQVVAAQGRVAERRQQERARAEAQRARAQPSVRAFFRPPPAGE